MMTLKTGELGSGHTVTALYEVIPVGLKTEFIKQVDQLKYQSNNRALTKNNTNEIMTIKLRYKQPDGETSKLSTNAVMDNHLSLTNTSDNFRFSAAVAEFGLLLRNSEYKQQANYPHVISLARSGRGVDINGYRAEFLQLVESAGSLAKN